MSILRKRIDKMQKLDSFSHSSKIEDLLNQLEDLLVDPSTDLNSISPYKCEQKDPKLLLEDLETLYLSSTDSPSLNSQEIVDAEEENLWSASQLHRALRKGKQRASTSSTPHPTATSTTQSVTTHLDNELQETMSTTWNTTSSTSPNMQVPDHGNSLRAKTYTNSGRYNRGSNHQGLDTEHQPASVPHNSVDLPSMYYDQNNNFFPPSYGGGGGGGGGGSNPYPQQQYTNSSMFNNPDNCQYMAFNQQQQQHQQSYNYQNTDQGMMNLNPYAHEFNPYPVNNAPPNHHSNHYKNNNSTAPHYKEEFSNDYSEYKSPTHHTPHSAPPPRTYHEDPSPVHEVRIPEGAVTLLMPHVYLGKFMMNRAEFESKFGVSLTTNSKDGGYLIIITGEKAAEAAKEVEMMWNDEPITNSEEITEGKHVIKVAPDRFEGVLCIPTEFYQKLLERRNAVESKYKVRILLKQLNAHNCYRAIIRAAKKETASEATDELETLIMSTETPEVKS